MTTPDYPPQAQLLAASYPSLTFDLTEDTEDQFNRIIPEEVIVRFSRFLDLPNEDGRAILLEAVEAFISGVNDRFEQRPEKQDNAALTKVASKAEQLSEALLALIDHPNLEAQLEERIRGFHALAETQNGATLPDLIDTRRNIFREFRDLLVDLQACTEATCNHQPKQTDYADLFEGEGLPTPQQQFHRDTSEWKRRSQARKLGRDHPLQCFLLSILPHWKAHVVHPFTEGMYFKELEGNLSPTFAELHPIIVRIDPKITRQHVANSIRKLRESSVF
ncbi:hypothetical protein DL239_20965 [Sedimentitalea sp. CY04]|uniref:Uncharacterized protein n=1 Tax=Parasedimentitalea denitrificans TaxID=2211118 RepID=A0ABX0WDW3_9RHOB|nr:hypothetical protein [Sedimentitalea sp. CY04]NIZ63438.1 hypothetical protein [Sedimentitalea sp. CY04]